MGLRASTKALLEATQCKRLVMLTEAPNADSRSYRMGDNYSQGSRTYYPLQVRGQNGEFGDGNDHV